VLIWINKPSIDFVSRVSDDLSNYVGDITLHDKIVNSCSVGSFKPNRGNLNIV